MLFHHFSIVFKQLTILILITFSGFFERWEITICFSYISSFSKINVFCWFQNCFELEIIKFLFESSNFSNLDRRPSKTHYRYVKLVTIYLITLAISFSFLKDSIFMLVMMSNLSFVNLCFSILRYIAYKSAEDKTAILEQGSHSSCVFTKCIRKSSVDSILFLIFSQFHNPFFWYCRLKKSLRLPFPAGWFL